MADLVGAPIEIAVVEFPGSRFNGEIVPALAHLVDDGIVTIDGGAVRLGSEHRFLVRAAASTFDAYLSGMQRTFSKAA